MALIVDGYNVIFAMVHEPLRYESGECERLRTQLLDRMEFYRQFADEEITVVFDGGAGGAHLTRWQHHGGLTVIFSDPDSDADAEIKKLVRDSHGAREITVVTDDRDIEQYVKRLKAKVMSTEELIRLLERAEDRDEQADAATEPAYKFSGPPASEVDAWVDLFEDDDENDEDEDNEP